MEDVGKGRRTALAAAAGLALGVACAASAAAALPQTAEAAAYNTAGYHRTVDHSTKSDVVLIGDSRTCQLSEQAMKEASAVAVWGGHYGYGGPSAGIDTASQRKAMKRIVRKAIKRHGKAKVYVFATVNDHLGGSSGYAAPAGNVVSLAKTVRGWSAKHKGKTVKPTVKTVSLVKASWGASCAPYNKYLKKRSKSAGLGYADITSCVGSGGYLSDGLHFNKAALKRIAAKVA